MAKHRSLRLQKKLHVGPFQQFGFALRVSLQAGTNAAAAEALLDDFLRECVDAQQLVFGGGLDSGWIDYDGHASATEAHRAQVAAWLRARPECAAVEVGPLTDAWYGPFDAL